MKKMKKWVSHDRIFNPQGNVTRYNEICLEKIMLDIVSSVNEGITK